MSEHSRPVAQARQCIRRSFVGGEKVALVYAFMAGTAFLMIAASQPSPRIIWNVSESAPLGLYVLDTNAEIKRGDWVLAWLPEGARRLADERQYLPFNTAAIKQVAGVDGDVVCQFQGVVSINGKRRALALETDSDGRVLSHWNGCIRLTSGEIFLMNTSSKTSFDGRYFGASRWSDILGRLDLWAAF